MQSELICRRCGQRWTRRKLGALPKQCPHCHSPRWNEARRNRRRSQPKVDGKPGRHMPEGEFLKMIDVLREERRQEAIEAVHELDHDEGVKDMEEAELLRLLGFGQ